MGSKGAPSTAQGQRIRALQALLGLGLPSPGPLRMSRSHCQRKCCLRTHVSNSGLRSLPMRAPDRSATNLDCSTHCEVKNYITKKSHFPFNSLSILQITSRTMDQISSKVSTTPNLFLSAFLNKERAQFLAGKGI